MKAIIDVNKNNKWNTGNFLEKVIYLEKELKVRANWVLNEIFTIK